MMVVGGAGCQNTELEGGKEGLSLSSTPPSFMEEKSEREQEENLIERQGKGSLYFLLCSLSPSAAPPQSGLNVKSSRRRFLLVA